MSKQPPKRASNSQADPTDLPLVEKAGADTTLIFVPPAFGADAIMEAADAGIKVIICIYNG